VNPWPFVIAAYSVCLSVTGALLAWALLSMRRAEKAANALTRQ